jgi:hypothetical protein
MAKDRSTKPSRSPQRNTFQLENYLKRCADEGEEPDAAYLNMWTLANEDLAEFELKPGEYDMEYDLLTSVDMLAKVRGSDVYAQNLYAAMCNREFQPNDTWPILTDQRWSCSWRRAGGIVADMRESGDYIDWYCSGMGGLSYDPDEGRKEGFVPESLVTDEIRADLFQLGWQVIDDSQD